VRVRVRARAGRGRMSPLQRVIQPWVGRFAPGLCVRELGLQVEEGFEAGLR
jgi:hypothetical protein